MGGRWDRLRVQSSPKAQEGAGECGREPVEAASEEELHKINEQRG